VDVTQAARDWLALTGFDPVYGARPLRRLVQSTIEDQLASKVLSNEVVEGSAVTFDLDDDADGLVVVPDRRPVQV
jgi:ATP-dependent Clp protease ATP-binding subunit ClpB